MIGRLVEEEKKEEYETQKQITFYHTNIYINRLTNESNKIMDYIIMNICIVKLKRKYNLNGSVKKSKTHSAVFVFSFLSLSFLIAQRQKEQEKWR